MTCTQTVKGSEGHQNCNTIIGAFDDSAGEFKVTVINLPPGTYTANITITAQSTTNNSMSGATIQVTDPNGKLLVYAMGTLGAPFSTGTTVNVSITPDASRNALIAKSVPRLVATGTAGQSSETVSIKVNYISDPNN
jgi:hypothetical protein